jgi:pimeloyl-ACP methyl ester carboxylesterase
LGKIKIKRLSPTKYLIESQPYRAEGLVVHGYGGNKEEMLGLALDVAQRSGLRLVVFDLPGHGDFTGAPLELASALGCVNEALAELERPQVLIGHSLGARVGLMSQLPTAVLISMPGAAVFEGSPRDLLRTLRARRVIETSPYSGLREILSVDVAPAPDTLMVRADHELRSSIAMVSAWQALNVGCRRIDDTDHRDVISSPTTFKAINEWLAERL